MNDFVPAADLTAIALRMVAPKLRQAARQVSDRWRANLPPEHEWVTMGDALVRETHRKVHGQRIPGNLRFIVPSPAYDRDHYGCGERQLLRAPRDRHGGTPGNTYNCRCLLRVNPEGIRRHVQTGQPVVSGTQVRVTVELAYPRIVESEYGTDQDTPSRAAGRALRDVAAEYR